MVSVTSDTTQSNANDWSEYPIKTWKWWCEKNNVDFKVQTTGDDRFKNPKWNKLLITDVGKEYDKVGIIDNDTMIKWDTPNIFELYDDEFCGVPDYCNLKWLLDSLTVYKVFFTGIEVDYYEYINSGVMFLNNKHLRLFEDITDFYLENKEELDNWKKGGGCDQTIINYFLVKNGIKKKLLSFDWNLLHINRKDMFMNNWQLRDDATPYFIKYGKIWHFTGFPVEQRESIMSQTWELIGGNYENN